jgi:hypothetical protein
MPLSPAHADMHRKRGRNIAVRYFLYGTLGLMLPLSAVFFAYALSQRVAPEGAIFQIIALVIAIGITIGPASGQHDPGVDRRGPAPTRSDCRCFAPTRPAAFTIAPMGIGAASTVASLFIAWWGVFHALGPPGPHCRGDNPAVALGLFASPAPRVQRPALRQPTDPG